VALAIALHAANAAERSPRDVYEAFANSVFQGDFAQAYSLLDSNARTEFATQMKYRLSLAGTPGENIAHYSDYDLFMLAVKNQHVTKSQIDKENVLGDFATVETTTTYSTQGPQKIIIDLLRTGGRWLIHARAAQVWH
jgi:hypothetical protein